MTEYTIKREEGKGGQAALPCRRNPNVFRRWPAFKEVDHSSPLLQLSCTQYRPSTEGSTQLFNGDT